MKRGSRFVVFGLVLALTLVGTSLALSAEDRPLRVAIETPLENLDPMAEDTLTVMGVLQNVYESLWTRTNKGELKGLLVESWDRNDLKTWTLHLREGVKFHNGNQFTAEDAKFSLRRSNTFQGSEFKVIGGSIDSMEIVDKHTLKVVTHEPWPTFPDSAYVLRIMDKEWTEAHDEDYIATHPMGTGPYKFVDWKPEDRFVLTANEDYWQGEPPIKDVIFRPIGDPSTRLVASRTGKVDLATFIPLDSVDQIKKDSDLDLVARPGRRVIFLGVNHREGNPTSNLKVRKAIYHAINLDSIIENIMNGYATPATQLMVDPGGGYNPEIERLPYDPEKAKELLKDAGYPDGFEITLDVPNNRYPKDQQIGLAVVQQLRKVGIDAELDAKPKSIHFTDVLNRDTDFWMIGWGDLSMDIWRVFAKFVATPNSEKGLGTFNSGVYSKEKIDQMFLEVNRKEDLEEREKMLQELNKMVMEDVAYIPLHIQYDIYAVSKDLNFEPRVRPVIHAKDISFKD